MSTGRRRLNWGRFPEDPQKYVASTVQVTLQDSVNAISQKVLNINRLQGIIDEFHLYEDQRRTKSADELVERVRKRSVHYSRRGLGAAAPERSALPSTDRIQKW